ncbi:MAG: LysE family transporter [Proteobacteria bacterium]|nr:LysE family transporter [Pseudomonadota bacterium]
MFDAVNLSAILVAAFLTSASPGPATLGIAGTSMVAGRKHGLALAAGITTGSLCWSVGAALGLGAAMMANPWLLEAMRFAGAAYLLWLAFKSARGALKVGDAPTAAMAGATLGKTYMKGLLLHLTNPKAILFFVALYAIGIPAGTPAEALAGVIAAVGLQSFLIFHGYALIFSNGAIARVYARLRRWFEATFACVFGYAGIKVLAARLN